MPDVPGDFEFPTQEILRYAVCELRDAYRDLSDQTVYPAFHAADYSVKIALQPKVDRELSAKAGLTGKSTSLVKRYSNIWTGGAFPGGGAPGAGVFTRGHQDGSVNFIVKSRVLLAPNLKIECEKNWSPAKHVLATNLGIRSWLTRSSLAIENDLDAVTSVDSQGFMAEIYVRFDAAGSFTYLFPLGADFASLGGQQYTDQTLTITVSKEVLTKPIQVTTIPGSPKLGKFATHLTTATVSPKDVSQETRNRLDLLQLQQTLTNLQVRVTQ
jgi:hypothetical protein